MVLIAQLLAHAALTLAVPLLYAAVPADLDRVRRVLLGSRHMGAHGLGYGERSLNELSQKLTTSDIPVLTGLVDDKNRSVASGAGFGLASQCGAAIDPVVAMATGARESVSRYSDAQDILRLLAHYPRCTTAERQRAVEKSALLEQAQRDFHARRVMEIQRRDAENTRVQKEGLKMLDPAQRAAVSREDCLVSLERSRAAAGIKAGANADADPWFARARAQCMNLASRP